MRTSKGLFVLLIVFVLFAVGIVFEEKRLSAKTDTSPPEQDTLYLSPANLLEDGWQKLEPHMRIHSGAVKMKYEGSKQQFNIFYEVWENGRIKMRKQAMGISIGGKLDGELSISLTEGDDNALDAVVVVSEADGDSYSSIQFDVPNAGSDREGFGQMWRHLEDKKKVKDTDEVAVFGVMGGEGTEGYGTNETIERMAERVNRALVFKIVLSDANS